MGEITVVIPNYNGMKYLPECLASLKEQKLSKTKLRVIVVDNGSTDGSVSFLKELNAEGFRLECIFLNENTGFDHAVNVGIKASESDYVILLNNDTKADENFVKALYDVICRDDKIFSVSAKMLMWDQPELVDDAGDRYCVMG